MNSQCESHNDQITAKTQRKNEKESEKLENLKNADWNRFYDADKCDLAGCTFAKHEIPDQQALCLPLPVKRLSLPSPLHLNWNHVFIYADGFCVGRFASIGRSAVVPATEVQTETCKWWIFSASAFLYCIYASSSRFVGSASVSVSPVYIEIKPLSFALRLLLSIRASTFPFSPQNLLFSMVIKQSEFPE